jgi:hypothetical protein
MLILRENDYEDNNSQTYHKLSEFIIAAENVDKSKLNGSTRLVKSAEALMATLD